ncbi:hypothetical protein GCM10029976_059100 [Kribbella albertanoniae]
MQAATKPAPKGVVLSFSLIPRVPDQWWKTCWDKACKNRAIAAEVIHRHPSYRSGQVPGYAQEVCDSRSICSQKVTPCSEVN